MCNEILSYFINFLLWSVKKYVQLNRKPKMGDDPSTVIVNGDELEDVVHVNEESCVDDFFSVGPAATLKPGVLSI